MKHIPGALVCFAVLGLLVHNGLADISLTLRNGGRPGFGHGGRGGGAGGGRSYLPPPVQELPISEEYIKGQEEPAPRRHPQRFEEANNYGGARYQIFEVHSHYEPQQATNNPHGHQHQPQPSRPHEQEIHIQHVNAPPNLDVDNLDVSFLSFAAKEGPNGEQITISEQLPPPQPQPQSHSNSHSQPAPIPVPFPSNYKHDFPKRGQQLQEPVFQAPDYLPPHNGDNGNGNDIGGPEPYRAPEYLPPDHGPSQQLSLSSGGQQGFQGGAQGGAYRAPGYLPPHGHDHHHEVVEHQDSRVETQHYRHSEQRPPFKGPDYLPPHRDRPLGQLQQPVGRPRYQAPGYLPPHEHQHGQQHQVEHPQTALAPPAPSTPYRAPEYLPPHGSTAPQGGHHHEEHHHVEHQHLQQVQSVVAAPAPAQAPFRAPEYLPPHASNGQTAVGAPAPAPGPGPAPFRAPEYLPPHAGSAQQGPAPGSAPAPYSAPEYLPPLGSNAAQGGRQHQHVEQHHVGHVQTAVPAPAPYRAPEYLPPHGPSAPQGGHEHHQVNQVQTSLVAPPVSAPTPYRGPGYLPPGYDFSAPREQPQQQQVVVQQQQQHQEQHQQHHEHQQHQQQVYHQEHQQQQPERPVFKAPEYLPPGYDTPRPADVANGQQQFHSQHKQQHHYQQQQQQQQQHQHQEFVVHSQIQVANDQIQQQPGRVGAPAPYQANGYLPPHVNHQQQQQQHQHEHHQLTTFSHQQQSQEHQPEPQQQYAVQPQAPQDVQAPAPVQEVAEPFQGPGYLPPLGGPQAHTHGHQQQYQQQQQQHHQHQSNLHSLSSYMTTVQPFERYGDSQFTSPAGPRKPFAQYGPPVTTPVPPAPQPLEVAPMYREQTARPPIYAPLMSYRANAVPATYTTYTVKSSPPALVYSLNEQTKASLQQIMPKEIKLQQQQQQHVGGAVAPITSGKIRTVQIVNPTAVKTIKVLETSDHAGVKTIKILGPTDEDPMGEHKVVKIVSQSRTNAHEDHVQTVKIFNDHHDVTLPVDVPAASNNNNNNNNIDNTSNGYLPPAEVKKRAVRDSRKLLAQPPRAAGRGRN